ncbi:MAG: MFS transporter [Clostridia bacterium]|nr:MFS transporter [Clostridia bacterium]
MINSRKSSKLNKEKASALLFIACWIAYAAICLSKNAYSASIASIVQEGILNKPNAGLINAAYWAVYGTAQLIGVKLIDRISPVHFITMALAGTALVNIGMANANSFGEMLILWSICGLLQFATWPAIVRIIVEHLVDEHKQRAMVFISFAQCAGLLINYLSAAVVLQFAGWNVIFITSVFVISAVLLFWLFVTRRSMKFLSKTEKTEEFAQNTEEAKTKDVKLGRLILSSGCLFLLIPSFVRAAMDNGIKTWVPTMITESYGVSASFSNILTMVLLVVNLSGVFICSFLYPKRIKNVVVAFALCFATVIPMTATLLFIGRIPLALVVALLAGVTTMMYAGYQMNYVIIPASFSNYGKSGSVASVLNAIASLGVLGASYGFGFLAEHTGWTGTITAWIIMATIAMIFCLIGSRKWGKFARK